VEGVKTLFAIHYQPQKINYHSNISGLKLGHR